jgi:hypothetical protein
MSKNKEPDNLVTKRVAAFLIDKPIWVWWIVHIAVTGALFGIFNLALYLIAIQWWVGVLILLITGVIWGSIRYSHIKGNIKEEKTVDEQPD